MVREPELTIVKASWLNSEARKPRGAQGSRMIEGMSGNAKGRKVRETM